MLRARTLLAGMVLNVACGGGTPAPTSAAPAPAPSPASTVAPPASEAAPTPECTSSSDCSFTFIPDVTSETDCICPRCRSDAMSSTRMDEAYARYQQLCPGYQVAHACAPVTDCGSRIANCIEGRCVGGPIAEADGHPAPCSTPADCGGARCVITALGGTFGCTNEACCETAECSNGCATDADCPACRPTCDRGSCRL